MNEQRTQTYLNLINQLLSCNDGDEPRILQENQELLDEGLVQVMVAVAQQYGEAGRENEAQWLLNMAQQLAAALGLSGNETTATANTPQDYFNFLMKTLQKISENSNPQVIYTFWAQNLDKFDENLIEVLDEWARQTLIQVAPQQANSIVTDIFYFSNLIAQFPHGNITTHKEIAITGYEIALTIFTFDAFPQAWARTQTNLGTAYRNRIRGDKAENLEQAISCYTKALKVSTFEAFPQDWATTQYNLALAYYSRIRGEKADNLEIAITAYEKALKVLTFDAFPQEWAVTQNNLGEAYRNRIRGDKAENLEKAIDAYKEALNVRTFDAFPEDWAMTQNNLAVAYSDRIRGDKACNLERAIAYCQEALKVYTFDAFRQQWAMTHNNLAVAYSKRIRGEKADNLEIAIAAYQEALKVFTFDAFPQQWAATQNNLAIAYSNRIRGDKAENIKEAVMCYQNALQGYETAGDFLNAAEMGLTLGKIKVDRGEWYQGLAYLEKSLKIYRQFDDLKSRADTIYQIAHTHHLIGNHEKASIYYRDALRFYEYLKHDRGVAFCKASLGRLMLQIGFVEKAEELLKEATFIFKELNNEQEIAKIAEVLNCLAKIKEKQAV
jgi:tetratricopeptide (TPR) repeat protein